MVAGGLASGISNILSTPADIVVQRLQVCDSRYRNGFHACREIFKTEGIRGFYYGFGPSLAKDIPLSGVWWMTYEWSKRVLAKTSIFNSTIPAPSNSSFKQAIPEGWASQFVSGFVAQMAVLTVGNPLEVITTRIQTANANSAPPFFKTFRDMVRAEGWRTFTRGLGPKIMLTAPISAATSVTYEIVLHLSQEQHQSS
jgi:hypothetical protein